MDFYIIFTQLLMDLTNQRQDQNESDFLLDGSSEKIRRVSDKIPRDPDKIRKGIFCDNGPMRRRDIIETCADKIQKMLKPLQNKVVSNLKKGGQVEKSVLCSRRNYYQ